jgi:hypothetical protein
MRARYRGTRNPLLCVFTKVSIHSEGTSCDSGKGARCFPRIDILVGMTAAHEEYNWLLLPSLSPDLHVSVGQGHGCDLGLAATRGGGTCD